MNEYAVLAARLYEELMDLERVINRAEELWRKSEQSGDDGYLDGVALNLHGFYAGVERLFEDIARNLDETTPAGAEWPRALLLQMSAPIADIRPAVIRRETRFCLDEYRGFRHVVRNVYAFNLKAPRLRELTAGLRDCYTSLQHDLDRFLTFLKQLSQTES